MAGEILEVREVFDGQELAEDRDGARSRARVFLVRTSAAMSLDLILQASDGARSIPGWGSAYVSPDGRVTASLVVVERSCTALAPTVYRVEVAYSSSSAGRLSGSGETSRAGLGGLDSLSGTAGADGSGEGAYEQQQAGEGGEAAPVGGAELVQNPLLRPPEIKWGSYSETEVAEEDRYGNPILNTAKMPFDPPLEIEKHYPTIIIEKNQSRFDGIAMTEYKDKVNNKPWLGKPAETWRILTIDPTPIFEEGYFYWRVRYEIAYRPQGWAKRVLNAGTWQFNAAGDGYVQCRDATGQPASRPVPLDDTGRQIPVAGGELASPAVYKNYYLLENADFGALKLFKVG